ncbi:hypothetical protein HY946_02625, partial [Candidatus Gottesmanbacteria bacterium]|nr:hypothetical protein [Candidatus Gottesmanbacteria bacterium]
NQSQVIARSDNQNKDAAISVGLSKIVTRHPLYSLLELYPQTGRTHQIRVHLKYLGHPIVGDEFYAGRKRAREDRKFCPRVFLHASFLQFKHPVTGEEFEFNLPLPSDLKYILNDPQLCAVA